MKVEEVTKNWKSLAGYVVGRVAGEETEELTQTQYDEINKASKPLAEGAGIDDVLTVSKKVMNLNILDKKVNFKEFSKFPIIWQKIYSVSMDVVAAEMGQAVMAR